jgi:hypothetical protein|mmetsp:Transcript_32455/g.53041  ORF Transcript_32455/g.53041 Transcript_32455/m.53041 type:complete len:93 (+) Transcript_32455:587-865(+)
MPAQHRVKPFGTLGEDWTGAAVLGVIDTAMLLYDSVAHFAPKHLQTVSTIISEGCTLQFVACMQPHPSFHFCVVSSLGHPAFGCSCSDYQVL